MKTPPHRIALVTLILLVLAGSGIWWWSHSPERQTSQADDPAAASSPEIPMARPHPVSESPPGTSSDHAADACGIAMRDAFNARARTLAQRQDSNSQFAYALAVPFGAPVDFNGMGMDEMKRVFEERSIKVQRAWMQAIEQEPDRRGVLFLAAASCVRGSDTCRVVQNAMLEAEPDNMAAWLLEMSWAKMRNDPDADQRAFEQAGTATRYENYADSVLKALVDAYGGMPMPVECSGASARAAMRRSTGMDHDFSMLDQALLIGSASRFSPVYNDIRVRCTSQPEKALDSAARVTCRNILTRMADGDTLIERAIGLGTMVQLAADQPDASAWRQRYREFQWIYAQLGDRGIQRRLQPEDYWLDEVRSLQAALEAAGRWPPPADWLPDDEHARSLIQTGRPPPPKAR